jgi:dienelactone hydrolase
VWEGFTYDGAYAIDIDAPTALCDTPIKIRVTGLQAQQPITLRAQVTDARAQLWESFATFTADQAGVVDVSRATPRYGTYGKVDAMGWFWSMLPVGVGDPEATSFSWKGRAVPITVTVEAKGKPLARAQVTRLFWLDETQVVRQEVRQDGIVATLFHPATPGKYPVVIVLPGSEGGLPESSARLLASHGYATLALAYFGIEALPQELIEIPLEYFARAIAWLKTQPTVDPARVAVWGGSKGGELALLLGATYPQEIKAVIGAVPSAVVYQGISWNPQSYRQGPRSSWTLNGKPVSFVPYAITPNFLDFALRRPIAFRSSYDQPLDDKAVVAAASIAVEKIAGPVLLVSGTDDQMWPSSRLADMAMERFKAHNHPFEYEHLKYKGAGHGLGSPCAPAITTRSSTLIVGGSMEANALARADAWAKTLVFLEKHLR